MSAAVTSPFLSTRISSFLASLVNALKGAHRLSVDVETTGTDPLICSLVGVALAVEPGEGWYVPLGHRGLGEPAQLPLGTVRRALAPFFADERLPKLGQNLKYDLLVLERHGMPLAGIFFDTLLASYCLDPSVTVATLVFTLGQDGFGVRERGDL